MPKIILRITGLLEILGRDYGIKKPYWGPSYLIVWKRLIARCCYDAVCTLVYSLYQGHPTTIFGKISVRKTILELEFSKHLL